MRRNLLSLIVIFLFSFAIGTTTAQTTKNQQSFVTSSMAKKISYSCQYNERMQWFFANANNINFSHEADKILRTLDKHLDYAEKYLIALYYNYGMRMGYFALKDMGFTLQETEKVEAVWKKEESKQQAIDEKEKQEKEQALIKRIEADDIFTKDQLTTLPDIEIDISNMTTSTVFNDKDELMNYDYDCIINKEGHLYLVNASDTLKYSTIQKFIYHYISDSNIDFVGYKSGYIEINDKDIPVNSYITIQFREQRYKHRGYLELTIKKNKKTSRWEFVEDLATKLQSWAKEDAQKMQYDLEAAIYNCTELNNLKGKIQLKMDVYRRVLKSNVSDETELSYYFDMEYLKRSVWEVEYLPLRYSLSF